MSFKLAGKGFKMKNMADVENTLRHELNQWFSKQCRNEWFDYYLYYLPTTPEHNGGILIANEKPANPEYQIVRSIQKHLTIDQNHRILSEVLRKYPILEY